jgi:hypothetical protein
MEKTMSSSMHRLALRAFTVIKREGQDDFWLPIGAAFAHEKGGGFNLILQALPIGDRDGTCKIVLRPPKEDDKPPHEGNVHSMKSGSPRRR